MTHGYATHALSHYLLFKPLSTLYRVLIFDNSSWGGNTRIESILDLNPAKADNLMLEWLTAFFTSIKHSLTPKFLVYAPSNGAY